MENFIYIRGLRHVEHTVFAVTDGQKSYYDPQFNRKIAYSSGQQVKRSIIEALGLPYAALTFNWEIDRNSQEPSQKEVHSPCDPSFADQLLGGYMNAPKDSFVIKRRSPLSISAMTPLHPLLAGIESENLTFDRTSNPENHNINVYWGKNKKREELLSDDELDNWLTTNQRILPNRSYIQDQKRVTGLFTYDIAIDLRTLFCVSLNKIEPNISKEIEEKLRNDGWVEGKNIFGKCLICPKEKRNQIIKLLAHALINWRIPTNQSRTFSLMETVAVAISHNPNQLSYAIRGELLSDTEKPRAIPKIDAQAKADIYRTPIASSFIAGETGSCLALDDAENKLIELMQNFDYENQL